MSGAFDPTVFRYTVRTPESRHAAIRDAAGRLGVQPDHLVQALFDCLDLSTAGAVVAVTRERFDAFLLWLARGHAPAAARDLGLTPREFKVFRALAEAAGPLRLVKPSGLDVAARAGVPVNDLDDVYGLLMRKGWIALAPSQGRGRRSFHIARLPE